ncbi:MAG: Bro-N domain-containing protein [Synergistaceae bacterium]|nr:Bro-N domain-containing protein [Synergistaceae bacterium]
MNNALQVFDYNGSAVRTVNKDGEIWFVAKDVCDVLELTNPTVAIETLDDDERSKFLLGRQGEANIINESGVYSLIFRSNKPEAKKFRKWVTGTVLPQIKRTGSFSVKPDKLSRSIMCAAKMIFNAAGIKDNQLALALDKIVVYYTGESMLGISGIALEAPTQNQLLNPTQIGKFFGKSPRFINQLLERLGFQVNIAGLWQPTDDGQVYAVMLDTGKKRSDGTPVRQLKWDSDILDILQEELSA